MQSQLFRIIIAFLVFSTVAHAGLLDAVRSADVQRVRAELANGADINQRDPQTGETALHIAAVAGNQEIVELLLNPPRGPRALGQTTFGLASLVGAAGLFIVGHQTGEFASMPPIHPMSIGSLVLAGLSSLFQGRAPRAANASLQDKENYTAIERALATNKEGKGIREAYRIADKLRRLRNEPVVAYRGEVELDLIQLINYDLPELRIVEMRKLSLNAAAHERIVSDIVSRLRPFINELAVDASQWENSDNAKSNVDELFHAIQNNLLPNLAVLRLDNNKFLTRLDFHYQPNDQAQRIFAQLLTNGQLSHLENLELSNTGLNPQTVRSLAQAIRNNRLSNLVHLGLEGVALGHQDRLFQRLHLPRLAYLNLVGTNLNSGMANQLFQSVIQRLLPVLLDLRLANNPLITNLDFTSILLDVQAEKLLTKEILNKSLSGITAVNLRHIDNGLDLRTAVHFIKAVASSLPNVTRLNLGGNNLGPDVGTILAQAIAEPRLANLTALYLSNTALEPHAQEIFVQAVTDGRLLKLTELELDVNRLGAEIGTLLVRAISNGQLINLITLRLNCKSLADEVSTILAPVFADDFLPNLQTAQLYNNQLLTHLYHRPVTVLQREFLTQIFSRSQTKNLQYLELNLSDLDLETVQHLARNISDDRLPILVHFVVGGIKLDHINDENGLFKALVNPRLSKLETLNLENAGLEQDAELELRRRITQDALPALSSLLLPNNRKINELRRVDLTSLGIDEVQRELSQMKNRPRVTELTIGTHVRSPRLGQLLVEAIEEGNLDQLTTLNIRIKLEQELNLRMVQAIVNGRLPRLTTLNYNPEHFTYFTDGVLVRGILRNRICPYGDFANGLGLLRGREHDETDIGPHTGQLVARAIANGHFAPRFALGMSIASLKFSDGRIVPPEAPRQHPLEVALADGRVRVAHMIGNILLTERGQQPLPFPNNDGKAIIELLNWNLPELRVLDLRKVHLSGNNLLMQAIADRLPHLTSLLFPDSSYGLLKKLLPAMDGEPLTNLTVLNFGRDGLSGEQEVIHFAETIIHGRLPNLQILDLGSRSGPETARQLANAIASGQLTTLRELSLQCNTAPSGFRKTEAYYEFERLIMGESSEDLTDLYIRSYGRSVEAEGRDADTASATKLAHAIRLGQETATALVQAIADGSLRELRVLDLSHSELGSRAISPLISAIRKRWFQNLRELNLSYNSLKPYDCRELADAIREGIPRLKTLNLVGNSFDSVEVRRQLPDCADLIIAVNYTGGFEHFGSGFSSY